MEVVEIEIKQDFKMPLLELFNSKVDSLTEPCMIVLDIESNGGYVEILEIMTNKIIEMKDKGFVFITNVNNYANSCAFALFLIGDIKMASDEARFIDHAPTLEVNDRLSSEDAKQIYQKLEYSQQVRDKIINENSNVKPEVFDLLKKNTTIMNKKDLIFLGLMEKEYSLN